MAADEKGDEPPRLRGYACLHDDEPETKRRVTETIERIRESRPKAYGAMSPHVMEFARQFFPDISEATAQRNCLDIMNCMSTREAEIASGSPYRTYMELNDNGMITLVIRKIA